jgi:hypothetical protein
MRARSKAESAVFICRCQIDLMRRLMPVRLLQLCGCLVSAHRGRIPLGRRRKRRRMRAALLRRGVCQHVAGVNDTGSENTAKSLRCINFLFRAAEGYARLRAAKVRQYTAPHHRAGAGAGTRSARAGASNGACGRRARRMRQRRYDGARRLTGDEVVRAASRTAETAKNRRGTCAKCDGHRKKARASSI